MGLITASIDENGISQERIYIGGVGPYSGFISWSPRHSISYGWRSANPGVDPAPIFGLFRNPESRVGFVAEGVSVESVQEAAGTTQILPITDVSRLISNLDFRRIQDFKNSNSATRLEIIDKDIFEWLAIVSDSIGWFSYTGISLRWGDFITAYGKWTNLRISYRLARAECSDIDNLPPGVAVVDADCGEPLPPLGIIETSGYQSRYGKAKKVRKKKKMGCCSCAAIADMNAQMLEQIKLMFDAQNNEIGNTLTEQTQFIQDQIVAAIPKGFDYQPIFNKIEDGTNKIWNGLNK